MLKLPGKRPSALTPGTGFYTINLYNLYGAQGERNAHFKIDGIIEILL
jgi:hypothetical protein